MIVEYFMLFYEPIYYKFIVIIRESVYKVLMEFYIYKHSSRLSENGFSIWNSNMNISIIYAFIFM